MKTLGLSIGRNALSAFLMERTLFSSRPLFSCHVPCREPYGSPDDIRRLAEEVASGAGGKTLPHAVISLPAAWAHTRPLDLPVKDLSRARKIHPAELDGALPLEDEEILSDILPSPVNRPGRFLAIAARRSSVEKTVGSFAESGFAVDRVITDHVAILSALLARGIRPEGLVVAALEDFVVLRVEEGAITRVRQFPHAMADGGDDLVREWREILAESPVSPPVTILGRPPAPLAPELIHAATVDLPAGADDGALLAWGAAAAPLFDRETGGFALRTSAGAESALKRERMRVRYAAAAGAAALIATAAALQTAKWAEARKTSIVQAQIRKEVTAAAPDIKNVVSPAAQLQSKLQALARERKETGSEAFALSGLLATVSRAFPAKEKMSVREVQYDAGRLRLSGEAESGRLVESFRTSLESAFGPGTSVSVEESRGTARGGSVGYTILVEPGGNGPGGKSHAS